MVKFIVKYKEYIQKKVKFLNNLPKKWQWIIICIIVIIIAIIYYFISEEKTKIAVSENIEKENVIASKNIQDEDKRKDDRIIYTIDKDMPVIKNPFSFEHEEKSDIKVIMNEDKKENKMDNRKVKVQTEQEEILKINKDETQIKNLTNNKQKIYKVKAILDFNQQKVALFSIDNKLYRVRQGDMIGDIKILAIESNSLILQENTGKKIKCPLT